MEAAHDTLGSFPYSPQPTTVVPFQICRQHETRATLVSTAQTHSRLSKYPSPSPFLTMSRFMCRIFTQSVKEKVMQQCAHIVGPHDQSISLLRVEGLISSGLGLRTVLKAIDRAFTCTAKPNLACHTGTLFGNMTHPQAIFYSADLDFFKQFSWSFGLGDDYQWARSDLENDLEEEEEEEEGEEGEEGESHFRLINFSL
ncbi:hypothetical protein BDW74DRAFT_178349 [Aspergillus multicolor]|uniref:uncharacterized protein n=1 Tax=Aspergillus multicolor TaxID=41759 RepID=UPI003CCCE78E